MKSLREIQEANSKLVKIANTVEQNFNKFDFGIITAWRDDDGCGDGNPVPKSKKQSDNKALRSAINTYTIFDAKGVFIENYKTDTAKKVLEDVFIVFDEKNSGKLENDLKRLGEKYKQDSVLVGKAGKNGILIGTSKCPNADPAFGKKQALGKAKFGKKGIFYTIIDNTPFTF